MAGVYIHIPFCKSKCGYCDFYSCTSTDLRERVSEAILRELELRRGFMPGDEVETIYVGGGTPSLLAPEQLQRFIDKVKELWNCSHLEEVTVELNPDDLSADYIKRLVATDVDRLSIGIQSFIDRDLEFMGRRHNARKGEAAVGLAQAAGFDNISIDLIYGIPGMSLEEWRRNLERAVGLGVQHLSAYHLTIEDNTPFGRRGVAPADEDASREQFLLLHDITGAAGMEHYEISNFALPGRRAKHNSGYWDGRHYLGVGPSAHSFNGRERSWSTADVEKYLNGIEAASLDLYHTEVLTPADRYNEYVMTSLRRSQGADLRDIKRIFGERQAGFFLENAMRLQAKGLLDREGERFFINYENFLISDEIISSLFMG